MAKSDARPSGPIACSGGWSYLDIFNASPVERIAMIKGGVEARWAKTILSPTCPKPRPGS